MISRADLKEELINAGIRPSVQRLAIFEYVRKSCQHPTAEVVYEALCDELGSLSLTTVYNTLKLFSENGIIKLLTIDSDQVRADGFNDVHGHFLCSKCRKLYDFPLAELAKECLEGFDVKTREVYYTGLCKNCKN